MGLIPGDVILVASSKSITNIITPRLPWNLSLEVVLLSAWRGAGGRVLCGQCGYVSMAGPWRMAKSYLAGHQATSSP